MLCVPKFKHILSLRLDHKNHVKVSLQVMNVKCSYCYFETKTFSQTEFLCNRRYKLNINMVLCPTRGAGRSSFVKSQIISLDKDKNADVFAF